MMTDSYTTLDLFARYQLGDNFQISLGLSQRVLRYAWVDSDEQLSGLDLVSRLDPDLEQLTGRFRFHFDRDEWLDGA